MRHNKFYTSPMTEQCVVEALVSFIGVFLPDLIHIVKKSTLFQWIVRNMKFRVFSFHSEFVGLI